jgi:hypothetical protein
MHGHVAPYVRDSAYHVHASVHRNYGGNAASRKQVFHVPQIKKLEQMEKGIGADLMQR